MAEKNDSRRTSRFPRNSLKSGISGSPCFPRGLSAARIALFAVLHWALRKVCSQYAHCEFRMAVGHRVVACFRVIVRATDVGSPLFVRWAADSSAFRRVISGVHHHLLPVLGLLHGTARLMASWMKPSMLSAMAKELSPPSHTSGGSRRFRIWLSKTAQSIRQYSHREVKVGGLTWSEVMVVVCSKEPHVPGSPDDPVAIVMA